MNKFGKYNTVIRLYDKYELEFASSKDKFTEMMKSQYDYAKDNIASMSIGA